jgi:hypothetical protein
MSTSPIRPSVQGGDDDSSEVEESAVLGGSGSGDDIDSEDESSTAVEQTRVVKLMPTHALPGANVIRRVGRPRKVEKKPDQTDLEYHALMLDEQAKFVENDKIVAAIRGHFDSADTLRLIKEKVAREAAVLEWQRIENAKLGRDTAQVSTRCIDALKKIADIELEIKKMGADTINLKSEKFQRVLAYLITCFRDVCSETGLLSPEQLDVLFNRLATEMEGWEEKASELVR